jgi:hypothetical protein
VTVQLAEYVPRRATVRVALDGRITEESNMVALGHQHNDIIGKSIAILSLTDIENFDNFRKLPNGSVTEQLFHSRTSNPLLTLMTTTSLDAATQLEFELINAKLVDVVFLLGEDGTIRDCSKYSVEKLTGYRRDQLLDRNLNTLVPNLFPAVPPIGVKFCCRAAHKDGRPFLASLTVRRLSSGQLCCQMQRHLTNSAYFAKETLPTVEIPAVTLGALLGVGAFSAVRLGQMDQSSQISAVKIIAKKQAGVALHEVEMLKKMNHDSIPKLHFTSQSADYFVIGMEFCAGIEMGHYLMSQGSSVLITEEEAKHYFQQLVSAVAYIHDAGIIHRDIKLENIIVQITGTRSWRTNRLKLIDFGLSSWFQSGVMQNTFCGSAAYASPEILCGTPYEGPEADVWAMGVVLYGMLCAKFPFLSAQEVRITAVDTSAIQSPSAANLVSHILTKVASNRLTVSQCLSHPWLNDNLRRLENVVLVENMVSCTAEFDKWIHCSKKRLRLSDSSSTDEPRVPKQLCINANETLKLKN